MADCEIPDKSKTSNMDHHRDPFLKGVAKYVLASKAITITNLVRLHLSEQYTDLTIVCGDTELKVHRAIVCPQSEFFRAACQEPGFLVMCSLVLLESSQ